MSIRQDYLNTVGRMAELYEQANPQNKAYTGPQYVRLLELKGLTDEAEEIKQVHKRLLEQGAVLSKVYGFDEYEDEY